MESAPKIRASYLNPSSIDDAENHHPPGKAFCVKAHLMAKRIGFDSEVRPFQIAESPLTLQLEDRFAVLFKFGILVEFLPEECKKSDEGFAIPGVLLLQSLPTESVLTETWSLRVDEERFDEINDAEIVVETFNIQRLQLVAWALAKSLVLEELEIAISDSFDKVEPIARELHQSGNVKQDSKAILKQIGQTLLSRQKMAGRANVIDKPDLLWDAHELESFYHKLEDSLEIRDRHEVLIQKLGLVESTAKTAIELVHTRHSLRLERYIVALILMEIVLIIYDIFYKH